MPRAKESVQTDRKLAQQAETIRVTKAKYKSALRTLALLEKELRSAGKIVRRIKPVVIRATKGVKSEATAFIIASDWHFEERIRLGDVNGLNEYNLKIARKRIKNFFKNSLTLLKLSGDDITINNIVLALLGDFINGTIHEEMSETNLLEPAFAVIEVQDLIAGGIQFLLDNTEANITLPCHSGNHARMTAKSRHSSEQGNSLETIMYYNLATFFKDEERVNFVIAPGHISYMKVYGKVIRFMHGHAIRYAGGIGGIDVPLKKGLLQWDKAIRADISVLGHWHQFRDGGHYIVNGSIVGYNAFALAIKADFEEPRQAFFLLDKKRGKTIVAPILVDMN